MATEPNWEPVRKAENYREFLRNYLSVRGLNFSDLARAAGFARGFPSDVISGRRRLTARSSFAFESALKIPRSGKKLFRFLVARDEPDLFPGLAEGEVRRKISELRSAPWTKIRREWSSQESAVKNGPDIASVLQNPHALSVYAAAGSPGQGATFAKILERTALSARDLETVLFALMRVKLILQVDNLYEPVDLHLFLKSEKSSEVFVRLFQEACHQASERAGSAWGSEREMFFASALCVDSKRLPELKAALRETVLRFVDDAIAPEGDRVVRLLTSLYVG